MRILVVDDDLVTRVILKKVLAPYGAVDTCIDGAEAVKAFTAALDGDAPFGLVCLDILMPNMGGLEALHIMRQEEDCRGRTPADAARIIMTTGSRDADTVGAAFAERCDAYVVKPIDAAGLRDVVNCMCLGPRQVA